MIESTDAINELLATTKNELEPIVNTNLPAPSAPIHLAASMDETRPVLTGVQYASIHGQACYAATDSYILGVVPIGGDIAAPAESIMIPADMAGEAFKADSKGSASITINPCENGALADISARLDPKGKRASTLHGHAIAGTATDIERLLNVGDREQTTIRLSVERLAQLAKALGAGKGTDATIEISVPTNALSPILVSAVSGPDGNRGLIMPVRKPS